MKDHVVPQKHAPAGLRLFALFAMTLVLVTGNAYAAGNAAAGKEKSFDCAGCHLVPGYRMAYPVLYDVPKLGGQHEAYIESALHEYQQKQRSSTTMQAIAAGLSEQDIEDLAAYFSGKSTTAPASAAGDSAKP